MHSPDNPANEATEFQTPPGVVEASSELEPGTRLGPYLIRRLLGEGGMGRVYLAEQIGPVRREVALKLIREQVVSPLARAYFDVERQALAQMQHPAIAQVFDAGTTEQGHPYLAMEVVEGSPLTTFCRIENLLRDERLALFARVCQGVQHAHQKGIIHRDLKPANVLVRRIDGEPAPKIIDFGIAIGGDTSGNGPAVETARVDRAGSGIYMSPEQSGREHRGIDTRSDVYSLGVMLYEVLTDADAATATSAEPASIGHRSTRAPHKTLLAAIDSSADMATVANAPDALLHAARKLPIELRAILRKALATDRADRYDSAAALTDDLERFRESRPVKALPQTRFYLARTFVARHRIGLAAATLAASALLIGMGLALHGLAQARQSAALARVEAAKAAQVSDFVRGMLAGIDPDQAKGMDTRLMHMVLDASAERVGRELGSQPQVRAEIEHTIADSYASLGELALAGKHYDMALVAADAGGLKAGEYARIAIRAAQNIDNQGHLQDAVVAGRKAFDRVASLAPSDRDRLFVESALAGLESDAGKLESARARLLRVLALQRQTLGDDHKETLDSIEALAIADSDMARFDEARPLYEELIARERASNGDENSRTLDAINGLAVLELEQKHYRAAEKLLAPLLPIFERLYGPDHPRTLTEIFNLGGAIRQQGRNEEARPYYERAFALSSKLSGPASPNTVMAETNLALLLRDAGDLDAADHHARTAAAKAKAAFGDNPARAIIYRELATILILERHYAGAEKDLDRAWSIFAGAKGYGPQHPRAQDVVDSYIDLYTDWGKPESAALWRSRTTAVAAQPTAP